MNDYDKKWVKWLILGLILGYIIGKTITVLLGIIVTNVSLLAFLKLLPPGCAVIGLLLVLSKYNKEKENELGE